MWRSNFTIPHRLDANICHIYFGNPLTFAANIWRQHLTPTFWRQHLTPTFAALPCQVEWEHCASLRATCPAREQGSLLSYLAASPCQVEWEHRTNLGSTCTAREYLIQSSLLNYLAQPLPGGVRVPSQPQSYLPSYIISDPDFSVELPGWLPAPARWSESTVPASELPAQLENISPRVLCWATWLPAPARWSESTGPASGLPAQLQNIWSRVLCWAKDQPQSHLPS